MKKLKEHLQTLNTVSTDDTAGYKEGSPPLNPVAPTFRPRSIPHPVLPLSNGTSPMADTKKIQTPLKTSTSVAHARQPGTRDPGRSYYYTSTPASTSPSQQHERRLRSRLQDSSCNKEITQYTYNIGTTQRLSHLYWHITPTVVSHDRTHTPGKRSRSRRSAEQDPRPSTGTRILRLL